LITVPYLPSPKDFLGYKAGFVVGQGLQDKIQLVAIDLQDKPAW
jgi:hypothetical protein